MNMQPSDTIIDQWRIDAIADGWQSEPLYQSEPEERCAKLTRDGWVVMIVNRPDVPNKYCGYGVERGTREISVWAPDNLAIHNIPKTYSLAKLSEESHRCCYCDGLFDETVRIGFAGRCCQACREKHVKEVEYPGWDN